MSLELSELEALRGRLRQLAPTPASEQELLSVLSHQLGADSSSLGSSDSSTTVSGAPTELESEDSEQGESTKSAQLPATDSAATSACSVSPVAAW